MACNGILWFLSLYKSHFYEVAAWWLWWVTPHEKKCMNLWAVSSGSQGMWMVPWSPRVLLSGNHCQGLASRISAGLKGSPQLLGMLDCSQGGERLEHSVLGSTTGAIYAKGWGGTEAASQHVIYLQLTTSDSTATIVKLFSCILLQPTMAPKVNFSNAQTEIK